MLFFHYLHYIQKTLKVVFLRKKWKIKEKYGSFVIKEFFKKKEF